MVLLNMNECATKSIMYIVGQLSAPVNCIDGAVSSPYDLPTKEKKIPIGEVLSISRNDSETIILCKVLKGTTLASGGTVGWDKNNSWTSGIATIKDIIQIGQIARLIV